MAKTLRAERNESKRMVRYLTDTKTRRGFTLAELLCVISIIVLVIAIALPAFGAARGRARETVCLSNLRQIGVAVALYAQDFDNLYPYGADAPDKYAGIWEGDDAFHAQLATMPLLQDCLHSYIKNADIWHCPSDFGFDFLDMQADRMGKPIPLSAHPSSFARFGSSYHYRTTLAFEKIHYQGFGVQDPFRPEAVYSTGQFFILSDGFGSWHGGRRIVEKRFNVLMADGHAETLNATQFEQNKRLRPLP